MIKSKIVNYIHMEKSPSTDFYWTVGDDFLIKKYIINKRNNLFIFDGMDDLYFCLAK